MDTQTQTMLLGVGLGIALSMMIVLAIRSPYMKLLSELSHSEARGQFWATVSILSIFLVGVQGALPTYDVAQAIAGKFPILGLATQIRFSMLGLLGSLVLISVLVVSYINRFEADREVRIPWEDERAVSSER